ILPDEPFPVDFNAGAQLVVRIRLTAHLDRLAQVRLARELNLIDGRPIPTREDVPPARRHDVRSRPERRDEQPDRRDEPDETDDGKHRVNQPLAAAKPSLATHQKPPSLRNWRRLM